MNATTPPPPDVHIRAATMADLPDAYTLAVEFETAEFGAPDTILEDLREEWQSLDLAADAFVAHDDDGRLLGAATVSGNDRMSADIWVYPHSQTLEHSLLHLVEVRAMQRAALVPENKQVLLERVVNGGNEAAGALLRSNGYALARRHWRMTFEMDAPPPASEWPEGIRGRRAVRDQDERAVHRVIFDAFEDDWERQRSSEDDAYEDFRTLMVATYRYDPDLWWIAEDAVSGDMAGVALGVDFPDMGWVRLVGVRRQWRRRGIALALLRQSFAEFYRRGHRIVSLGVDSESPTKANKLYERAGMHVSQQLDQYRKVLRAGEEAG